MYVVGEGTGNTFGNIPNMNTPANAYFQNVPPRPQPAYNFQQVWSVPPVVPQQSPAAAIVPQNTGSSYAFYRSFLKVKPKALGIVLIVAGALQFALGVGLALTLSFASFISGIPFWGPIFYIIAGALTIAAECKPNICLVKGSLSLNIISSVFSLIAFILNCVDLATIESIAFYYVSYSYSYNYNYNRYNQLITIGNALQATLLIINLLLFSVSLSVSIFGCRSLSRVVPNAPQVLVMQNDAVVHMNPYTAPTAFTFPPPQQPPPYMQPNKPQPYQ